MKLPSKSKEWLKEAEVVIDDAFQKLEKANQSRRVQFETALGTVIDKVSENRDIERAEVSEKVGEVVEGLAEYLKSIPENQKSWPGMITFMYFKFHQALGLINEQQMLKIVIAQQIRGEL